MAIMWRFDLVTTSVPLTDLTSTCEHEVLVLGVCGREANMGHSILLLYGLVALPCLDIPQTDCFVMGS